MTGKKETSKSSKKYPENDMKKSDSVKKKANKPLSSKELKERLEFEELISDFSSALINQVSIHKKLDTWLQKFADFLEVDRVVVIEYLDDMRTVKVLMQYSSPEVDVAPLKSTYVIPDGEVANFKKGMFVRAEKIPDDLPEMLRNGFIEADNTKSVVIVPLAIGERVIGSLTYANYRKERKWPDDIVRRIRLIGEIIANAIIRKRAGDELLEEMHRRTMLEEKYSSILKNASVGFMITDFLDLSIIDVNDEYCRMTGYSREELLSKKIWEIDIARDPEKAKQERNSMIDQKGVIHLETSHIKKDGSLIDVAISSSIFEQDGIVCTFVQDITGFNKTRKEQVERIEFEELISEFSADLINVKPEDIDKELFRWLKSFVKALKIDRGMINEYLYDQNIIHMLYNYSEPGIHIDIPDENMPAPEGLIREFEKGITIKAEKIPDDLPPMFRSGPIEKEKVKSIIIVPLKTGNTVIGNLAFVNYREDYKWPDELARRIKLIGEIFGNAILRIRSQKALFEEVEHRKRLEEKYSSILKNANVGFWITKYSEASIIYVNDEYCRLSGYSRDELLSKKIWEIDSSLSPDKIKKEGKALDNKGTNQHQTSHRKKDGTLFDVEVSSNYFKDEDIVCSFMRDVTEVNRAKQEQEERLRFEEFVSEFSAALMNIKPSQINDEIGVWLDKFVYLLDVDRAVINEYVNDRRYVEVLLDFIVPGVDVPIDRLRPAPEGVIDELEKGVLKAENIPDDLPEVFRNTHVEDHKTRSLIVVPLLNGARVFGNLSFVSYRKNREWADELVRRIKLVGEIVGNAILRMRSNQALNRAHKELEDRLRFEELTSQFSAALINIDLDDIDEGLKYWLIKLVEFLKVDRGIVYEYQGNKKTVESLIHYTAPGVDIDLPEDTLSIPDKLMARLREGIVIRAEKVPDDLPEEFRDWVIEEHGTKSLVMVPLKGENRILGNLSFTCYREERKWSDEQIRRITLIGEIIANVVLRKRSSDALIAEMEQRKGLEERYSTILKTANVGFMITKDQHILVVNDEYCRMSGYSREELLKMDISDIDISGDRAKVNRDGAEAVRKGAFYHESKHVRKDGRIIDVEIRSNYLEKDGIYFSFTRDITELNQAKRELEERLEFEALISEFSAALINIRLDDIKAELDIWLTRIAKFLKVDRSVLGEYSADFNTYIYFGTYTKPGLGVQLPPFPTMRHNVGEYGLEKYLLKGESIKFETPDDKMPDDLEKWKQEVVGDGTKSILMLPLIAGDVLLGSMIISTITEEKKWTDDLVRKLRLVAGIFANSLMREKTDMELDNYRKHLEKMVEERTVELRDAQKELVISEKMATLGKLTATVSHELRNPLGTIRASVFSVQKRLKGQNDKVATALNRAERNIKRCDLIIDELLNYSRVQELELKSTPIDEWLNELLDETGPGEGISIKKDLNADIIIGMDQERFRRCMVNILTNAYQSIQEKDAEEPGLVHVISRKDKDNLIIEVIDNGAGFDMKKREKLFEPLYSTKTFGVGLGLPITRQIIERHGWNIEITGEPGKGASVTITSPI